MSQQDQNQESEVVLNDDQIQQQQQQGGFTPNENVLNSYQYMQQNNNNSSANYVPMDYQQQQQFNYIMQNSQPVYSGGFQNYPNRPNQFGNTFQNNNNYYSNDRRNQFQSYGRNPQGQSMQQQGYGQNPHHNQQYQSYQQRNHQQNNKNHNQYPNNYNQSQNTHMNRERNANIQQKQRHSEGPIIVDENEFEDTLSQACTKGKLDFIKEMENTLEEFIKKQELQIVIENLDQFERKILHKLCERYGLKRPQVQKLEDNKGNITVEKTDLTRIPTKKVEDLFFEYQAINQNQPQKQLANRPAKILNKNVHQNVEENQVELNNQFENNEKMFENVTLTDEETQAQQQKKESYSNKKTQLQIISNPKTTIVPNEVNPAIQQQQQPVVNDPSRVRNNNPNYIPRNNQLPNNFIPNNTNPTATGGYNNPVEGQQVYYTGSGNATVNTNEFSRKEFINNKKQHQGYQNQYQGYYQNQGQYYNQGQGNYQEMQINNNEVVQNLMNIDFLDPKFEERFQKMNLGLQEISHQPILNNTVPQTFNNPMPYNRIPQNKNRFTNNFNPANNVNQQNSYIPNPNNSEGGNPNYKAQTNTFQNYQQGNRQNNSNKPYQKNYQNRGNNNDNYMNNRNQQTYNNANRGNPNYNNENPYMGNNNNVVQSQDEHLNDKIIGNKLIPTQNEQAEDDGKTPVQKKIEELQTKIAKAEEEKNNYSSLIKDATLETNQNQRNSIFAANNKYNKNIQEIQLRAETYAKELEQLIKFQQEEETLNKMQAQQQQEQQFKQKNYNNRRNTNERGKNNKGYQSNSQNQNNNNNRNYNQQYQQQEPRFTGEQVQQESQVFSDDQNFPTLK